MPRGSLLRDSQLAGDPLQLVGGRGQVDDQRSHDEAPTQASTQNLTTHTAGRYWNRLSSSSEVTISLLERTAPR